MTKPRNDDDKSWADKLREDIRKVTGKEPVEPAAKPAETDKSLHERIQERMRDLDKRKE